jgi:hypothetical protein
VRLWRGPRIVKPVVLEQGRPGADPDLEEALLAAELAPEVELDGELAAHHGDVVRAELRADLAAAAERVEEGETHVEGAAGGRAGAVELGLVRKGGGERLGACDSGGQRERGETSNAVHVDPPMRRVYLEAL